MRRLLLLAFALSLAAAPALADAAAAPPTAAPAACTGATQAPGAPAIQLAESDCRGRCRSAASPLAQPAR